MYAVERHEASLAVESFSENWGLCNHETGSASLTLTLVQVDHA